MFSSGYPFYLFFLERGMKKAVFPEPVVETCQKEKFCYIGLLFSPNFVFLSILLKDFLRIRYHLQTKVLEPSKNMLLVGTPP